MGDGISFLNKWVSIQQVTVMPVHTIYLESLICPENVNKKFVNRINCKLLCFFNRPKVGKRIKTNKNLAKKVRM